MTVPTHRAVTRRGFLQAALAGSAAAIVAHPLAAWASENKPKAILLRCGWQFVNIGDIAQTPGGLHLLEQYFPDAQISLSLAHTNPAITAMIAARFPKVQIVEGTIDPKSFVIKGAGLKAALEKADLVIHGSAASISSLDLLTWCQNQKKAFGVLGVTLGSMNDKLAALLSNAKFVFARDTLTLDAMKKGGVKGPALGFMPDSAFAIDVSDEQKATPFLKSVGLVDKQFICVVPRLRYTPYTRLPADQLADRKKTNEKYADADHKKLRDAMVAAIKKTSMKVLVCPEMTYEIDWMDKLLIDPLPEEVKKNVVKRSTFWLPDEAASVYARAAAVVSFELHSPIIALANGTPAIYLRQPTDGRKGQMMRDIGLPTWIEEIEETTGDKIAEMLLAILADAAAAKAKVAAAMAAVAAKYKEGFATIEAALKA